MRTGQVDKLEKVEEVEWAAHEVVHEVIHKIAPKVEWMAHEAKKIQFPPGCVRNRPKTSGEKILKAG